MSADIFVSFLLNRTCVYYHFTHTSSLRNQRGFWPSLTPANSVAGHLSFILHTVTSFHRLRLYHYYGIIWLPAPLQLILSLLLISPYHLGRMGRRSPVITLNPCKVYRPQSHIRTDQVLGLRPIWQTSPPNVPYQVRLRSDHLTSYRFLHTTQLPVTHLRVGLTSPWSGRPRFLATERGFQLCWANQKKL